MDRSHTPRSPEEQQARLAQARKNAAARRAAREVGGQSAHIPSASRVPRSSSGQSAGTFSSFTFALWCIIGFILAFIFLRLFFLSVIDGPEYATLAKASRTNVQTVLAKRGTIYDRSGNILATSVECKTVYANPHLIKNVDGAAQILSDNLGGDADLYKQELTKDTTFVYVERKVDENKAETCINELEKAKIDGIYVLQDMKRLYPYGDVAGQVLGVVGTDGDGLSGLELQYNDLLGGKNGEIVMERGRDGTPIAGGAYQETPAENGTDIVISLDINIQEMAEKKMIEAQKQYSAKSGMVTVANPQNGELLAMCSTPLLNPSDTANLNTQALALKGVSEAHEPGSVLKILTCAIGEENGDFSNSTSYSVPDSIKIGENTVHDEEKRSGTETMTPREIMRVSSNIGAVLLGRSIGVSKFSSGLSAFGIGTKTGVDFPGETAGIVPSADKMTQTDLSYMAFGQSLAIPQIQLVRAVDAIANKGILSTPHFLVFKGSERVDWPADQRACSEETAENITDLMRTVVQNGTAKSAGVAGYDVAAKTGTGEQAGANGYLDSSFLSTLIGFAPANDAKVCVCVSLSGVAYLAAESAAPVFSSIMSEALLDLGIGPS